ncbi:hypothetical protein AMST5_01878 [freshwater sediment metagenome]|uniref:Uncharacterized protein n=1 Tax=freshwater sediment metagenome TaxID=556182 RepID=A0AA48LZ32_9ZZZZ
MSEDDKPLNEFQLAELVAAWATEGLRYAKFRDKWFTFDGLMWRPVFGELTKEVLPALREQLADRVAFNPLRVALQMLKMHPALAADYNDLRRPVENVDCYIASDPMARVSKAGKPYAVAHARGPAGDITLLAFDDDVRLDLMRMSVHNRVIVTGEARPPYEGDFRPTIYADRIVAMKDQKAKKAKRKSAKAA